MKNVIHNLSIIFFCLINFLIILGFLLPISIYESNYIIKNKGYETMIISSQTYNEIKNQLQTNQPFNYYEKNTLKEQTIVSVDKKDNHAIIYFSSSNNDRFFPSTQVSFFLKKTPYWFEIFKHY